MDRDVVQVFGRPKVIPSDAPWTSVNHTPGSTGSTADLVNRSEIASPAREESVPPVTSPVNFRSQSTSSVDSSSQENADPYPKQKNRRRGLRPLTRIQPLRSQSYDNVSQPPPNVLITTVDSDGSRSSSRGLSESLKEEKEEDPWAAWRRLSDTTTVVPGSSSRTQRPSAINLYNRENLRPPSPKLRTKSFRPGWATRQSTASTDSLDNDIRQSIDVKFTRGNQFGDVNNDSSQLQAEAESEDDEADGNVIYLHSPSFPKTALGLELDLPPNVLSPTPKYAYTPSASGLEDAVSSQVSPSVTTNEEEFRATGRKWFEEHRRLTGLDSVVVTPVTTSFRPADIVSSEDFKNLKVAVKGATGEVEEKKKSGMLADPIGRALCVFAVVLLVKILLK